MRQALIAELGVDGRSAAPAIRTPPSGGDTPPIVQTRMPPETLQSLATQLDDVAQLRTSHPRLSSPRRRLWNWWSRRTNATICSHARESKGWAYRSIASSR